MHRLGVQRIARRGPCSQTVRLNSTSSTGPKDDATPPTKENSSHPRVSSYHGLSIPSREDVLRNPNVHMAYLPFADNSRSFKPSISYLKSSSGNLSFAQRLARQQLSQKDPSTPKDGPVSLKPSTNRPTPPKRNPTSTSSTNDQRPPQRDERPPAITLADAEKWTVLLPARQKAALAKEARNKQQLRGGSSVSSSDNSRKPSRYDGVEISSTKPRGPATPNRQSRPQRSSNAPDAQRKRDRQRRKPRPKVDQDVAPVNFNPLAPVTGTLEEADADNEPDEWDPDETPPLPPHAAGATAPDIVATDIVSTLNPIGTYAQLSSASTTLNPAEAALMESTDRTQWVLETIGGDYSKYAPQVPSDFVTAHANLGPLKHSQLVLAHRRDVSLAQRGVVGDVVRASVQE
ncbi:hypothetical protein PC9H_003314 [Pleurotus ostreatus]|uniref:Uncharacterized protein n=2 Tax=Pleurotus TaxID=5320 RepID=A0A8H7A256_PLEOS|nr:uncharacterized protein PC9H_003314 [Pleurotus ostreatus]KAF7436481.1 hypothetical protein PC9H_003314 [Pleurotus ostreatus]KAG9222486.1 hypothetical protein CCMSSC00406_0002821 [Pleurotus cornucopiae]